MFSVPWQEALIIIFFFYGLAFYSMGLALFVESGRASELGFARSMRFLAGFGILHGIHEWLDMTEQGVLVYHQQPIYTWLMWFRLAILVTSFLALLLFGEQLLMQAHASPMPAWHLTVGAATWYVDFLHRRAHHLSTGRCDVAASRRRAGALRAGDSQRSAGVLGALAAAHASFASAAWICSSAT